MNKWLSFRRWKHILSRVWVLLSNPQIAFRDKLLFLIPVGLYWVLPDILLPIPFFPIDDIAVTLLASTWFARWIERKYGIHGPGSGSDVG
ncbi:hypothetical protein DFQ01_11371 [Paenibacillus cellulosilyticus]|uniref:DUF1232 domain-containing protein n=1 Tax=Paenibacillus cellulosilyticus TaxID=375489 RepID=A0A2V2YTN9_9BACL|nr:hypothetical protein [Paenibacillus cellulosilyticus]PWV99697.1 hypothetical protein DFQ01_11371 [Paenibacillus cellulosilyticus]QKS44868.1 hypothetical protein HUB94_10935 [Paenibacillus cellulosilyticus]